MTYTVLGVPERRPWAQEEEYPWVKRLRASQDPKSVN